ncbi:MAG: TRAP transporter small permease subunit [Geminicoccaceae bacterium]|nr:TRAP transporter small permease subunit [Geminicoccaceae bacterium]MCB9966207.1 TRAP transporter small permease subunit [Geminicoccaceae bacterium]
MLLAQFLVVVLRYLFGTSYIWGTETVLYLHAALFMLGAGYTLLVDGHVRVDILYAGLGERGKALVDLLGTLLFLLPTCLVILWFTWRFTANSWAIREGPLSVGGIPASFLLKTLIPAFAILLLIQGISLALRSLVRLQGGDSR